MTAPGTPQEDADTRQVSNAMSDADANNRAVERVINLLNEIVAEGTLPVL